MGNQAMYQQLASYKLANETVQKTRQLVMLYDAVIRNLKQARQAMEEKRFADRYNLLTKAKAILSGLHCSLDHNKGGDIATMLNSYYIAMDIRINNLNGSNSTKDCDGVIDESKNDAAMPGIR